MPHIDKYFDKELEELKGSVLQLGGMVEGQVLDAIKALMDNDIGLAKRTIKRDFNVNKLEVEIDERCMQILALRQPVVADLRFVATALKIIDNLERMGDMAVNISERVYDLAAEPRLKRYIDIPKIAEIATGMMKNSLDAFVERNVDLAYKVIRDDDDVDDMTDQIFRELLVFMLEDSNTIKRAIRIMFISKYLERIADHATNIAEMVVYMVKGKIIRHTEPEDEQDAE